MTTSLAPITLAGDGLELSHLVDIARHGHPVAIDDEAFHALERARRAVVTRLESGGTYYGINTGFGYLADVHIAPDDLAALQVNLVRSHACAVGTPLPDDVVRAILALRIQTMIRGNSGVTGATVRLMAELVNRHIVPVIPSKGSVGASGDLAPLAHLAMALIGEGTVRYHGEVMPAARALAAESLEPLCLEPKEGLCLINGTQVMTAVGLLACHDVTRLAKVADIAAAMTLDAFKGTLTAFRPEIQAVRPHAGQATSARNVTRMCVDDAISLSHVDCPKVQDPYSIRCTPQVHGAVRGAFAHVLETLLVEANSSTDNPLVFAETNEVLSGGNFHGEPVALVLDYLAMAVSELGSIAEKRIEKLINPSQSGLPPFLTKDSGLHSGFMIPHVVAAALVNENKVLSHPASVDTISTSADKEDHVSMGMTAANKLGTVVDNVAHILAIELLAAAEGVELHAPLHGGVGVMAAVAFIRERSPALTEDRSLSAEIETMAGAILDGSFIDAVEAALDGPLE